MDDSLIVVEGYRTTPADDTDLRRDVWSFALDQRAFGPRRLVVAFTDQAGRLLTLAHARRPDPPEAALAPCIEHLGGDAVAAVAFCDQLVVDGPPSPLIAIQFALARSLAGGYGIHLVDWIACDDQLFRSSKLTIDPHGEWWDVPERTYWTGSLPPSLRVRPQPRWVPRNRIKRRR